MREARELAEEDEVLGEECSERIVVPWAMQVLGGDVSVWLKEM